MGGKIALAIAARRPHRLHGLVLIAPSPPTPEPIPEAERARLIASWGDRDAMTAVVDSITVRPLSRSDRERQVADMLAASKTAWDAWLSHGSREDISSSLAKICVPVTIVAGGADQTITPALLRRELLQRLPGATMGIVLGAGHLLPIEAHDEVADIILRSQPEPVLAEADSASSNGRPRLQIW
jgi:pimeloyl-ACP methyl ester carboxylesterase